MKKIKQEVITRFSKGDEEAFTIVYNHYIKLVHFLVFSHFHNQNDIDDIVQEVFIDVYKYADKMTNQKILTTWINKITYAKSIDHIRKKSNKNISAIEDIDQIQDTSVDSDILDLINRKFINDVIQKSILNMSYDLKVVGLLRFYEQLSLQDISDILEIPAGTVKSRINTIKHKLKDELNTSGIYKAVTLPVIFPMAMETAFKGTIDVGVVSIGPLVAKIQLVMTLVITSTIALTSSIFIRNNIDKEKDNTPIHISFDQEYTNTNVPIKITSSVDYDYYIVNGITNGTINTNGDYEVGIIKDNKEIYTEVITINNIDKEAPQILSCVEENGYAKIKVSDTLSKINPSAIQCLLEGNIINEYVYDQQEQCITLKIEDNKVYEVYIYDYANNGSKVEVNISQQ